MTNRYHGILVQLPLPDHIDADNIINGLDPLKDVDGLHSQNAGLLSLGQPRFVPATPLGVQRMLIEEGHRSKRSRCRDRRKKHAGRQAVGVAPLTARPRCECHSDDVPHRNPRRGVTHAPSRHTGCCGRSAQYGNGGHGQGGSGGDRCRRFAGYGFLATKRVQIDWRCRLQRGQREGVGNHASSGRRGTDDRCDAT